MDITTIQRVKTLPEHKKWLESELEKNGVSIDELKTLSIALGNALRQSYLRIVRQPCPRSYFFYQVTTKNGERGKGWVYLAELALWLKYTGYQANDWLEFISSRSRIQSIIRQRRLPSLSQLIPSTRISRSAIKELDEEFYEWSCKH